MLFLISIRIIFNVFFRDSHNYYYYFSNTIFGEFLFVNDRLCVDKVNVSWSLSVKKIFFFLLVLPSSFFSSACKTNLALQSTKNGICGSFVSH